MPNNEETNNGATGPEPTEITSRSSPQSDPPPVAETATADRLFGNLLKLRNLPCVVEPEYRDEPREAQEAIGEETEEAKVIWEGSAKPTARWQFQFVESKRHGKTRLRLVGARRNARGPWKKAKDLPEYVRHYLCLLPPDIEHYQEGAATMEDFRTQITEYGDVIKWHPKMQGLTGTVWIDMPVKKESGSTNRA